MLTDLLLPSLLQSRPVTQTRFCNQTPAPSPPRTSSTLSLQLDLNPRPVLPLSQTTSTRLKSLRRCEKDLSLLLDLKTPTSTVRSGRKSPVSLPSVNLDVHNQGSMIDRAAPSFTCFVGYPMQMQPQQTGFMQPQPSGFMQQQQTGFMPQQPGGYQQYQQQPYR
jgi:hypothetical protein